MVLPPNVYEPPIALKKTRQLVEIFDQNKD